MTTQTISTNLYKSNEFSYTIEEFKQPLKTRTGKTRLDRYGNPLTSIRIKQSGADKQRMIDRMQKLYQLWKQFPDSFPVEPVQFGLDPVPMDCDRVFNDLLDQIAKWLAGPTNDVLESFIIRNNYYVDFLKKQADLYYTDGSVSAQIEMDYAIRRVRKRKAPIKKAIDTNFDSLFRLDK